jgi:hypothetical protein
MLAGAIREFRSFATVKKTIVLDISLIIGSLPDLEENISPYFLYINQRNFEIINLIFLPGQLPGLHR